MSQLNHHQNGKGSKCRISDFRAYGEGWDRVFGGKVKGGTRVKPKQGLTRKRNRDMLEGI